MKHQLSAASGLPSFDSARSESWVPQLERVHASGWMMTLEQRVPPGAGDNETLVPPNPQDVLLFWARGQHVTGEIEGRAYETQCLPWSFTLLPAGTGSLWHATPQTTEGVFHIHLDPALYSELGEEGVQRIRDPQVHVLDLELSTIARWVYGELGGGSPVKVFWDSAALLIGLRLVRGGPGTKATVVQSGGLAPWQVKRVCDYLQDDLARDTSLAELAALVGLTQHHFCRAFKVSTGLPPHRWLIARRVELARELLLYTNKSVIEIALDVGYENPNHLSRVFRQATGLSPREFRRLQRR